MRKIIVSNAPEVLGWQLEGIDIVSEKEYLTNPDFARIKNIRIFNLCKEYKYLSKGYYVSLLAEARGHRPLPEVRSIVDLQSSLLSRVITGALDEIIQKSFRRIRSDSFILSIYFGKNIAKQYQELCTELHHLFQAPFLRVKFVFSNKWQIQSLKVISFREIPVEHYDFLFEAAQSFFQKKRYLKKSGGTYRYDLAILYSPHESSPPSNKKALQKLIDTAEKFGLYAELITKEDFSRLSNFDALFIRETTRVNHHTYDFSRWAEAEGLAIIDEPGAILKCCNKVYLAELLNNNRIPVPRTQIINRRNYKQAIATFGFPCVLKLPDSSFSLGVCRINNETELKTELKNMFAKSDLIIAQEYIPTSFDWRIGLLNGHILYACKYYMAPEHWQIYNWGAKKKDDQQGNFETFEASEVPKAVQQIAIKAAKLIGNGLFGIDIKETAAGPVVIEVNDNPNIDYGVEDFVVKDKLYNDIITSFIKRIEIRIQNGNKFPKEIALV